MSTYSNNLRIELITTGTQAGTWGDTTNTNLGTVIEDSIAGYVTVSVISANQALTAVDGAADQARNAMLRLTTTTGANFAVYAPPASKQYIILNDSAYTATIYNSTVIGNTTAAGLGVAIPAGKTMAVWSEGTDFYVQNNHLIANLVGNVTGNVTGQLDGSISSATTATTQAPGTNTTQVATTAFVQAATGVLGTMSAQNANNVAITGGSITGATLNASDLSSGTVPTARLASSGTPSNTTFLRGDQVWATPANSGGTVTSIVAGSGLTGGTITSSGTIALDVYTGTTVNNTSYPYGAYLLVTTGYFRYDINSSQPVYTPGTSGGSPGFANNANTGSSAVAGTWRLRGWSSDTATVGGETATAYFYLMQRTA